MNDGASTLQAVDAAASARLRVWIDQDLCTGDGLCTDHAPDVFRILEDGIAYVVENGEVLNDPGSSGSMAVVPQRLEQAAIDSAGDCPGECIFIEFEELPAIADSGDTDRVTAKAGRGGDA